MTAFLGSENVSNVPLQALETNRFSSSQMYGKLANIYADLSAKAMNKTGAFKMATGGDSMLAEKKFKEGFSFRNYAKLIFSCNEAPAIGEDSLALWRRFILIRFENIFIDGINKDPMMLQKLTTKEELSGIFNIAIDAHRNLTERGYFDYDTDIDEVRRKYTRMSNSLKAFIEECVVQDYDAWVTKDEFFTLYREWVMKHGLKLQSKNLVGRRVPEYTSATSGKPGGGSRKECWIGIRVLRNDKKKSKSRIEEF
ncbi:MAG: hypothetical protein JSV56_03810 [Methanomassiliicoccales archaeon]|nr:MAG: hypothetical protein JSV56_03810 [Methanomassiliicoccales archaeon]